MVGNLPSSTWGCEFHPQSRAKIPCVNKATKLVHCEDPVQPKKLKSNKYTNVFSNRRANTRCEESEPQSESPGKTCTQDTS